MMDASQAGVGKITELKWVNQLAAMQCTSQTETQSSVDDSTQV